MIQKICFLVNENQYDSKTHFTQELAKAFEKRAVKTLVLAPEGGNLTREHGKQLENFQPDLTCSFNSINPLPSGQALWDILRIPHFFYNLDSALYVLSQAQSPYIQISCVDHSDVDFMQRTGFTRAFFLPHAASAELRGDPESERPYEVIFFGSCYDHEALRKHWHQQLSPDLIHVTDNAIDMVLSDRLTHFLDAITRALAIQDISPKEVNMRDLALYVDYYCRGRDRWELVRAIKDVPLHIFGGIHEQTNYDSGGWAGLLSSQTNVTLHPPVSYEESLCLLAQSKFCLNSCPSFKQGSHERVFAGMALGSVPLSNDTLYWREEFREGESVLLYEAKHWQEANEKLLHYLANEGQRREIAERGRQIVMEKHTWDQRVETLLETLPICLGS